MLFFSLLLSFGLTNEIPPITDGEAIHIAVAKTVSAKVGAERFTKGRPGTSTSASDSITASYTHTKMSAGQLRMRLRNEFRKGSVSLKTVKTAFTDQLVDKIIPHWYGTPWSWGGHTTVPKQGKIACGYFVSTTLRDMGLNLNRYKLAQKSPIDEAKMISCGAPIDKVKQDTPEEAHEEIDRLTKEGLYFIGFDEGHVGYLLKREGELFLIHSNYLSPVSVCMETLKESRVFKKFDTFYLVPISHNETLLQRWLNDEQVL